MYWKLKVSQSDPKHRNTKGLDAHEMWVAHSCAVLDNMAVEHTNGNLAWLSIGGKTTEPYRAVFSAQRLGDKPLTSPSWNFPFPLAPGFSWSEKNCD